MNKRNQELDSLRALSVLLVVLAHSGLGFVPGGSGVTFFFVISGFIITKLITDEISIFGNFNVKWFYLRRFWKIFPPFFAIILLPSFLFFDLGNVSLRALSSQIFFYFNWYKISNGSQGALSGTGVAWSLSIEEQFYIAIAMMVWIIVRIRKVSTRNSLFVIYVTLWLFSTNSRIFLAYANKTTLHDETGNLPRIYFGTDTRISSICAGGLLALSLPYLHRRQVGFKNYSAKIQLISIALISISLTFRGSIFRDSIRFTLQELAFVAIILTGSVYHSWPYLVRKIAGTRIIQTIGLASYSIYLSHLIIINIIENLFKQQNIVIPDAAKYSALTIMVISIGIVLHFLTDIPFESFRQKYRR